MKKGTTYGENFRMLCLDFFCEIECTNLASRPFGYPNGNFLVMDTLRPAFCIRL